MISFEISINKPQPFFPFAQMLLKGLSLLLLVQWLGFPAPRSLVQTEVPELKCFESLFIVKKIPFLDNPISLKITSSFVIVSSLPSCL